MLVCSVIVLCLFQIPTTSLKTQTSVCLAGQVLGIFSSYFIKVRLIWVMSLHAKIGFCFARYYKGYQG
jgi:preprotein translocase subunit SecF